MATLYITYRNAKGKNRTGQAMPALDSAVLASQALVVSSNATDAVSNAGPTEALQGDIFVTLFSDTAMFFQTGSGTPSAGTATARDYLPANLPREFFISSGHKIAARLVV